jgi:hypothetical protein
MRPMQTGGIPAADDTPIYAEEDVLAMLDGLPAAQLQAIWSRALQVRRVEPMRRHDAASGLFGEPFLWALWAQKA